LSGDIVDDREAARRCVLISYAHESSEHIAQVRELAELLVRLGVDARLDQFADNYRQDWVNWTLTQMRQAERVLVVVSPTYRRRFEQEAPTDEGRGVQLEALVIREEIYRDQKAALQKFLPVLQQHL
jgi:SEFIR domain